MAPINPLDATEAQCQCNGQEDRTMVDVVDWSAPLEAVGINGTVMEARLERKIDGFPDSYSANGLHWLVRLWNGDNPSLSLRVAANGVTSLPHFWRIRNVAQPATRTAAEMLDRLEALVRDMAKYGASTFVGCGSLVEDSFKEARAIVAELAPPVDPDLVEARALFQSTDESRLGSDRRSDHIARGDGDNYWEAKLVRSALARGRELARAEMGAAA